MRASLPNSGVCAEIMWERSVRISLKRGVRRNNVKAKCVYLSQIALRGAGGGGGGAFSLPRPAAVAWPVRALQRFRPRLRLKPTGGNRQALSL